MEKVERNGEVIYTTSRERTLVDLLDRIELMFDPSRLWRAFRAARSLNSFALLRRARILDRAVTYARLGLFLETTGGMDQQILRSLEWRVPKTSAYFNRVQHDSEKGMGLDYIFEPRWRLVVESDFLHYIYGKSTHYRRALTSLEA